MDGKLFRRLTDCRLVRRGIAPALGALHYARHRSERLIVAMTHAAEYCIGGYRGA